MTRLKRRDWFYFFGDMDLDPVPSGAEQTWIWNWDSLEAGKYITNPNGYTGFLLYAYGIHTDALRSGGEGSYAGGLQTSGVIEYPQRNSLSASLMTATLGRLRLLAVSPLTSLPWNRVACQTA